MPNLENVYGYKIGQMIDDMVIVDMYRNPDNRLMLKMECTKCDYKNNIRPRTDKMTPNTSHDYHSTHVPVEKRYHIGQQINDMVITDMYRKRDIVLEMECTISECDFTYTIPYYKMSDYLTKHSGHSAPRTLEELFPIGTIINDMTIIGYDKTPGIPNGVIFKCNICGKEKTIRSTHQIRNGPNSTSHSICKKRSDYMNLPYYSHRLYSIWRGFNSRIYDVNNPAYPMYGGRGLTSDYDDFMDFYNDMAESYVQHVMEYGEYNTTIDRINGNKGYIVGNVRWATKQEQVLNRYWLKRLFTAYAPDGKVYISDSKYQFALNHGLDNEFISNYISSGRMTLYNGWFFTLYDPIFIPNNAIYEFYYTNGTFNPDNDPIMT